MPLSTLLVIIACVIVVLIFILFPGARTLLKGFIGVFIKDMASTPEGAKAIYDEKIDKAQDAYNEADDAYKRAAGKLSNTRNDLDHLKKRLAKCEADCEALVKAGRMEDAQIKADEREEVLEELERCKTLLAAYEDAEATAKEAYDLCEKRLRDLKKEAKRVVENMKVKAQLKEVYDSTDDLKAATATDKLLETVREKNKSLDEIVEGSRVVHNNRTSTKVQKAEANAKKLQSNDYLESLKKKYNK